MEIIIGEYYKQTYINKSWDIVKVLDKNNDNFIVKSINQDKKTKRYFHNYNFYDDCEVIHLKHYNTKLYKAINKG